MHLPKGNIFLVSCKVFYLQIQHVTLSPLRNYQVQKCLFLPNLASEQVGGMCCGPTKGMPFFLCK
jgi:hypothetical protein